MALTTLFDSKIEIPISNISEFIKKQKQGIIDTIKARHDRIIIEKAEKAAAEARKALPPIRPPDGPTLDQKPVNRAVSGSIQGKCVPGKPLTPLPGTENIDYFLEKDRFEIPLATPDDFVEISQPALSGASYISMNAPPQAMSAALYGGYVGADVQNNPYGGYVGTSAQNTPGIFKDPAGRSIKRMPPPNRGIIDRTNYLLETTREMPPRAKSPQEQLQNLISAGAGGLSRKEMKEVIDILMKSRYANP
jgi:hypothetical protein